MSDTHIIVTIILGFASLGGLMFAALFSNNDPWLFALYAGIGLTPISDWWLLMRVFAPKEEVNKQ